MHRYQYKCHFLYQRILTLVCESRVSDVFIEHGAVLLEVVHYGQIPGGVFPSAANTPTEIDVESSHLVDKGRLS